MDASFKDTFLQKLESFQKNQHDSLNDKVRPHQNNPKSRQAYDQISSDIETIKKLLEESPKDNYRTIKALLSKIHNNALKEDGEIVAVYLLEEAQTALPFVCGVAQKRLQLGFGITAATLVGAAVFGLKGCHHHDENQKPEAKPTPLKQSVGKPQTKNTFYKKDFLEFAEKNLLKRAAAFRPR